jgi:hypothetical protein
VGHRLRIRQRRGEFGLTLRFNVPHAITVERLNMLTDLGRVVVNSDGFRFWPENDASRACGFAGLTFDGFKNGIELRSGDAPLFVS